VPVSKSSAILAGGGIGWSRWQCPSTPPGSTLRRGAAVARAARQAFAQRDDAAVAHADVCPLRIGRRDHHAVPDD